MAFEPCDRLLYWEQGFWGGAVKRWYAEGMPNNHGVRGNPAFGDTVRGPATPIGADDKICPDIAEAAGLDKPSLKVPVELYMEPAFKEEIQEETPERLTVRDELGITKQLPKSKDSIPRFIAWPVADLADWEMLLFDGSSFKRSRISLNAARV